MVGKCFRRIFFASLISLFVTFGIVTAASFFYYESALTGDIKVEAEYAAHGINLSGQAYLDSLRSDHRITLIDSDGTVLFDNRYDIDTLGNHADRDEFIQALESGSGVIIRQSATAAERYIYYAQLLDNGKVLRVSGENISVLSLVARLLLPLLLIACLLAVFSYFLARQISKSIRSSADEIDLDNPENTIKCPEFAPLLEKIHRLNSFISDHIAQLSKKQEELGVITENMSEGFIVANRQREILSFNSSAIRILGSGLSSGRSTVDSLGSSEPLISAVNTALSGRRNEQSLTIDGAIYRIIANPVCHNSDITGVVIVILDVTEKEKLEQMRREFTSNVSHELKTPLTSIRGAAEMLAGGMVKQEDTVTFAGTIHTEANRLMALIEDILRLSQLDEEGVLPEMTEIDLHQASASVLDRLSVTAHRQSVSLALNGEPTVITGVPTVIDELIYNLCDNAIKYNVQNGSVTVTTGMIEGRPSLVVADTGIGISKEHIGRIFERFYRIDKSRSRAMGGTGLGLSIVKHAAARHGADIRVSSEEGAGTSITILF